MAVGIAARRARAVAVDGRRHPRHVEPGARLCGRSPPDRGQPGQAGEAAAGAQEPRPPPRRRRRAAPRRRLLGCPLRRGGGDAVHAGLASVRGARARLVRPRPRRQGADRDRAPRRGAGARRRPGARPAEERGRRGRALPPAGRRRPPPRPPRGPSRRAPGRGSGVADPRRTKASASTSCSRPKTAGSSPASTSTS